MIMIFFGNPLMSDIVSCVYYLTGLKKVKYVI